MARTFPENLRGDVQVDHYAPLRKKRAVSRVEHDAAACRKNEVRLKGELIKRLRLAPAEAVLALNLKNGGYGDPGTRNDLMVAIGKAHPSALCEFAPNSRFSGTQHADQYQTSHTNIAGFKCTKGRRPRWSHRPRIVAAAEPAYLSVSESDTIRGVTKISSSLRSDTVLVLLNNPPTTGSSPRKGTRSTPLVSSSR